jgi:hypothetical protein
MQNFLLYILGYWGFPSQACENSRGSWNIGSMEQDPSGSIPLGILGSRRLSRDSSHSQIDQMHRRRKFGGRPGSVTVLNYAPKIKDNVTLPCGRLLGWTLDFGLRSNLVNLLFIGHYI